MAPQPRRVLVVSAGDHLRRWKTEIFRRLRSQRTQCCAAVDQFRQLFDGYAGLL